MAVDLLLGSIDDEELRARALQGYADAPLTPLPTPSGHSAASSIAPASKVDVPQHRPILTAPRNIMLDVIDRHTETERLTGRSAKIFDADVSKTLADVDKLSLEKEEAIKQEAEAAKSRSTWSVLSIIAQYVTSIAAITLGLSVGGWPAVCLVGAGVIGAGDRILHDTNLLNVAVAWLTKSVELQKKITHNIEMGAFFLQMGLGLAGGIWAWQTGAFAASGSVVDMTKKVSTVMGTASGLMTTGSQVGIKFYDKKMADLQARMKEINGQVTTDHQTMYQDTNRMSRWIESDQLEADEIRKATQALQVSID